ncbi:MAG: aldehyde ferredoxin oxidoreductase N-terminal domain-containing protein [Desulfobacterales bacterium]|nr:aldehyde ferredoxin oxidoreductase N-terminal domain-containing protein [Desulfobacterales bacterium]
MTTNLKTLIIDAESGFYKMKRYPVGRFFGPVDLGLYLSGKFNSLNFGTGLLAGSVFPGANRLVFTGFSPCWGGFFISSMGGAGLVFDNLGINQLSIKGKAPAPSILFLNRTHGEEIEVEIEPVDVRQVWHSGRGGIYSLMDYTYDRFGGKYKSDPRILAVGPAAEASDIGAIGSVPIKKGELTRVDTWAGRGGLGSKLFREHGIAAVIYGGTHITEDFINKKVADEWFQDRYEKKLAAKDIEATTKYRFEPKFQTGGTFGVNYATMGDKILAFNYRTIYMTEQERNKIQKHFIEEHYLKQFNEETIQTKSQKNCGEPCAAVCKKMRGEYKKDYEPYQTLGPLCGIFDQRAAEKLNHTADMYGFDAISIGGVLSWLMESVIEGIFTPEELGVSKTPIFDHENFDVVKTSLHNAEVGVELLNAIVEKRGVLDLHRGIRRFAHRISMKKQKDMTQKFLYTAFGRRGWMVPNQYWTPGVLSPMAIMGKYYMYYGGDFLPPRTLGQLNAARFKQELVMDNMGMCRFHREWAEEMLPDIVGHLFGKKEEFQKVNQLTASRINSRNASVFWETNISIDFVYQFLKRKQAVDGVADEELTQWIKAFDEDKNEAALNFWYEIHKGIQESLRRYNV